VLVRFEQLHTVANRLDVKVLVVPEDKMINKDLDVLTTDTTVQLYPENDLGDLQYPVGKSPAQVATTIEAIGNPGNWPFDTYKTDQIHADVLVATSEGRRYIPARVEVTGSLDGWDISVERVGPISQSEDRPDNVIVTLHRAKGPLIFDLGICPGPYRPACVGIVGGDSDGAGQDVVPAAVFNVVRRDAVRHRPAAQYLPRLSAARLLDRPGPRALGVDSAGRRDDPVCRRLDPATGSKDLKLLGTSSCYPVGSVLDGAPPTASTALETLAWKPGDRGM
jgi:hypothetical protein